jgi:hypothetical protein
MKKLLLAVILVVLILGGGILIGWKITRPDKTTRQVSSQMILSALRERGFFVTETSVSTVAASIKTNEASVWKRVFWGQEIEASGVIEVNLGVDLAAIKAEDISVNNEKVVIAIPSAEIFNSRLVGDINVENKQGILKRLLENDDGYNQAMAELIKQAEGVASSTQMMAAANSKAKEEIGRLVGYMAPGKEIEVVIK